jgi:hypothetical protein
MNDAIKRQAGPEPRWLERPEVWIAFAVFLGGAYFYGSGSWNQNARLDAIFTFVEPGLTATPSARFVLPWPNRSINTGDWALVGTHYLCEQGTQNDLARRARSLARMPARDNCRSRRGKRAPSPFDTYWMNLGVSVMPLAVASLLWYRLLARRVSAARAATLTLLTFLGSALFPYSTQLCG